MSTLGFRIYLNPNDMSQVSPSIAARGWISLPITELLLKVTRVGMTVVDIGANIGFYSLLSGKRVGELGRVIAFEPEQLNFSLLVQSIEANGLKNVSSQRMALADKEGITTLFISPPSHPEAHSIVQQRAGGVIEVPCTTLDRIKDQTGNRIDLVKIHVGAEHKILSGGLRMIRSDKPKIVMAFGGTEWSQSKDLLDELFGIYNFFEVVPRPWLVKGVSRNQLLGRRHTEVFLSPKP